MVRKASKLKQKQKQKQKQTQIVNITLAKEPKRKAVKRRSASAKGTQQQPQQNYTGGFTPVYIQSGNLAEQNINPLIKTIEELKESIKTKPVEKQLVMRPPMKPLEYETGFDFTDNKYKNKVDLINEKQAEIVKPSFVPEPLSQKAEEYDTPFSLGISRKNSSINPAFSEPVITQAQIMSQTGRGKGKGGGKGLLPVAKTEDEIKYQKEKKKYDRAVNSRKKAEEKAQNEGKPFRPRKNLPPPPVRPSNEPTNYPYDL